MDGSVENAARTNEDEEGVNDKEKKTTTVKYER